MLRYAPSIAWQEITGEVVVLDLSAREVLGLNQSGSLVWRLIETCSRAEIADRVAAEFEIDAAAARGDVDEFLTEMVSRGLVVEGR